MPRGYRGLGVACDHHAWPSSLSRPPPTTQPSPACEAAPWFEIVGLESATGCHQKSHLPVVAMPRATLARAAARRPVMLLFALLIGCSAALTPVPRPSAAFHAAAPRCRPLRMADGDSRGGLRLLEWIPSQKLLVGTARFTWTTIWRTMISELAPQSPEGAYVRPAPQAGSGAKWPSELPMVPGRYHVYVGSTRPVEMEPQPPPYLLLL